MNAESQLGVRYIQYSNEVEEESIPMLAPVSRLRSNYAPLTTRGSPVDCDYISESK